MDALDAWFRVSASTGGLAVCAFLIAYAWTSPTRGHEWTIFAVLASLPLVVAFVFALLSVRAANVDRRAARAQRMQMDFRPVRGRVEPESDEPPSD